MAITQEQLNDRMNHLGSSDIAAILNLDPFKSAYDVWLDKTSKLEPEPETKVQRRGNFLEPALLNYAESILGPILRGALEIKHKEANFELIDHPDGVLKADGIPLEAKSQGAYSKEEWGEAGTDQIPDRVIIQCEVHILCAETDFCHVPAYLPYREFQLFGVARDNDVIDAILEAAETFWVRNVQADIPPDAQPSLSTVKRIRRYPDIIDCIVPDDLVERKKAVDEVFASVSRDKREIDATLIAALGQAEVAKWSGGIITYKEYQNKGCTIKPYKGRKLYIKRGKTL